MQPPTQVAQPINPMPPPMPTSKSGIGAKAWILIAATGALLIGGAVVLMLMLDVFITPEGRYSRGFSRVGQAMESSEGDNIISSLNPLDIGNLQSTSYNGQLVIKTAEQNSNNSAQLQLDAVGEFDAHTMTSVLSLDGQEPFIINPTSTWTIA